MKIVDKYDYNKYIEEKENYVLAVGGDGTLIRAIHKFGKLKKPFFGVAAGTANFLMNEENEINIETSQILEFNLLKVTIFNSHFNSDILFLFCPNKLKHLSLKFVNIMGNIFTQILSFFYH